MDIRHKICHISYRNADFGSIFLQKDSLIVVICVPSFHQPVRLSSFFLAFCLQFFGTLFYEWPYVLCPRICLICTMVRRFDGSIVHELMNSFSLSACASRKNLSKANAEYHRADLEETLKWLISKSFYYALCKSRRLAKAGSSGSDWREILRDLISAKCQGRGGNINFSANQRRFIGLI